jgi:hypothetical protein
MKIIDVEPKELGTVANRIRSTTAGLTSGYQRTANSSSGVSVVETTAGYLLVEISTLPWYSPLPSNEPNIEIPSDLAIIGLDELAAGYKAMAGENSLLAEESLPIAQDAWPTWEE